MNRNLSNIITKIHSIKSIIHQKDKSFLSLPNTKTSQRIDPQYIIVLFYFIGLAARLSEIDSATNEKELDALIKIFPNFLNASHKVKNLYNSAITDQTPALNFAKKIRTLYPNNKVLMQQIVENLIKIADADEPINTLEYMFINNIANEFGFEAGTTDNLIEAYFFQESKTPYEVLGVSEDSSIKDISEAYKAKMFKFHPDKIHSHNDIAPAYKNTFEKKYQEVSNAYQTLLKMKD
jgi:DnaJ-domain-containing protein 1